jgi:hypothetical protein
MDGAPPRAWVNMICKKARADTAQTPAPPGMSRRKDRSTEAPSCHPSRAGMEIAHRPRRMTWSISRSRTASCNRSAPNVQSGTPVLMTHRLAVNAPNGGDARLDHLSRVTTVCDKAPSPVRVRTWPAARARRGWPRVSSLLDGSIERREFFLLAGAVATGAGLAGCTSTRHGSASPSRPGSSPAAPSPSASLPGSARMQLGPRVVHGPRGRARVALTFHGQGPVSMAGELLAGAERARARVTVLAVGPG